MSYQFISVKCPECGASFPMEEGRKISYCSYCGTKILISNENEHIYHSIDEAAIKQAEADRAVRMKMLEMEERANTARRMLIIIWLAMTGILLLVGIIGLATDQDNLSLCFIFSFDVGLLGVLVMIIGKKKPRYVAGNNEAMITEAMENYSGKNYNTMISMFRAAGFTNISAIPLHDLSFFSQSKKGQVASISIFGDSDFEEGDVFPKSANIQMTYHSR